MNRSPLPRELMHFLLLDPEVQAATIRRMSLLGWSDYGIAAATRLSVEQIRRALADPATSHLETSS